MKTISHLELTDILRTELEKILAGPGVTWNMKGILNAFDRATAKTAFLVSDMEKKP